MYRALNDMDNDPTIGAMVLTGSEKVGTTSVENSSNGLIYRKKRAKNGHFFS